ncbi:unnamed protein product [Rangifer tarandus platyrhynchus]|uniref:Uncharacterized protein n=1 Tax=Rangifer tarandus platyrhynchus TaxID=3082113 RepID=A0ABN8ZLK6_RANTA|nr:unnamed protein product [Rangifer tarandus platyrhynchus]
MKAIIRPYPDSRRGRPPFYSFSSGSSPLLCPLFSSSVAATTHFTLGRIFSSPAPNPDGNETNFLSAAHEGGPTWTLSILRMRLHTQKGETTLTNAGKLLSSIFMGSGL